MLYLEAEILGVIPLSSVSRAPWHARPRRGDPRGAPLGAGENRPSEVTVDEKWRRFQRPLVGLAVHPGSRGREVGAEPPSPG
jgi:hypothetical protein